MKIPIARIFLLCVAALWGAHAAEPAAHVHGVATLDIAVDASMLRLNFESPLDNLVGFEHPPRNDKETHAIQAMAARFAKPQSLFTTPGAARCAVVSVRLSSPVIEPRLLGMVPGAAAVPTDSDGHAEIEAQIEYRCENPHELKSLEARIIGAFPGIHRLDTQVAGPRRQSASQLTGANNKVFFPQ
jgi:hypothetical protein